MENEQFRIARLAPEALEEAKLKDLVNEIYGLWPKGETPLYEADAYNRCIEQGRSRAEMLALFELAMPAIDAIAKDRKSLRIFTAYAKYADELLARGSTS